MSSENFAFDEYISNARSIDAKLSKLAFDMLRHVKLADNDYFGVMAAAFAYKQLVPFQPDFP